MLLDVAFLLLGFVLLLVMMADHHISTDEVYGSIEEGSFAETDPLGPRSPYSASKAGCTDSASPSMAVRSICPSLGISKCVMPMFLADPVGPHQS